MEVDPGDVTPTRTCALCRESRPLERSHIIPKFVYRWLKDTGTGVLRRSDNPNRRHQDGGRIDLLCRDCETRFSVWEREFNNRAFLPYHNAPRGTYVPFEHGDWGLKFATSLSWRALQWLRTAVTPLPSSEDLVMAEETWRRFLLGELKHPDRYEQRFFRLNEIAEPGSHARVSTNLNRYWMRGSDISLVTDEGLMFVYTKFGRFAIAGLVSRGPRDPGGYRIRLRKGQMPKRQEMSLDLMHFMNGRADLSAQAIASLSDLEHRKNEGFVRRMGAAYFESDSYRAIAADLRLQSLPMDLPPAPDDDGLT